MNLLDEQTWNGQLVRWTQPKALPPETLRIGECLVDCRTGIVQRSGIRQRLRRKELELLAYLHERGTPVHREELLRVVWNCSGMITRTVDQTVATLRRKLNDDPTRPKLLLTVYGVGYEIRNVAACKPTP